MNFCCRDYNPKAGFASHNPVVSKQTCKDRSKGFRIQRIVSFLFQNCQFFQRGVAYEYNKSIQYQCGAGKGIGDWKEVGAWALE